MRYPEDSPVIARPAIGSYVAVYWVLDGHHDEWTKWGSTRSTGCTPTTACSPSATTSTRLLYTFRADAHSDDDGVPVELALDRGYPGLVVMMAEPPEGEDAAWLVDWVAARRPTPADQVAAFTSVPLLADAPPDVPLTPETERVTLLWFDLSDPLDHWAGYETFAV